MQKQGYRIAKPYNSPIKKHFLPLKFGRYKLSFYICHQTNNPLYEIQHIQHSYPIYK